MAEHTELIPMDDPGSGFDIVMRGYDRQQVTEQIERLEAELRVAAADRDSAAARSGDLAGQLAAAQGEIESLRARLEKTGQPAYERMSERITGMLNLAEAEADDIRRKAEADAERMRARAEQAVAERRADLDRVEGELRARRQAVEQQCSQLIFSAEGRAKSILAEAEAAIERDRRALANERREAEEERAAADRADAEERQRLHAEIDRRREETLAALAAADAEAQQRRLAADAAAAAVRAEANEDFEITLTARRARAHQELVERQRESVTTAARTVGEARAHAEEIVGEARRQVAELTRQRDEMLRQLRSLHQLLLAAPERAGIPAEKRQSVAAEPDPSGRHSEHGAS